MAADLNRDLKAVAPIGHDVAELDRSSGSQRQVSVGGCSGPAHANVLRMVVQRAVWQVGIGLLIGIPSAILAGHLMAAQLYGTVPHIALWC